MAVKTAQAESTTASAPKQITSNTVLVGLDLGTNCSCLKAGTPEKQELNTNEIIPTVVGYAKEGLLEGILPGDSEMLFGDEARKHALHLRLEAPLREGVIKNQKAAGDFANYLSQRLNTSKGTELRAVIGVPATADDDAREAIRTAFKGIFNKVILIPEPFLAALGYRDETKLGTPGYIDPVNNSIFIDIGAGSADLCLVQGYYPQAEDQISLQFAGDSLDTELAKAIQQKYPDCDLSLTKVREIKETHSYVGKLDKPIVIDSIIGGKQYKLDVGEEIGASCKHLLEEIFGSVRKLISTAMGDSVPELLKNIIVTGGGSQIRNFDSELQRLLEEDGYLQPRVRSLGPDYKEFVAKGAIKAARAAKERQWQNLIG